MVLYYSRPVSDGWVLPEGGAEGGDLLGHPLQLLVAERTLVRVVQAVERLLAVQGENLSDKKQKLQQGLKLKG